MCARSVRGKERDPTAPPSLPFMCPGESVLAISDQAEDTHTHACVNKHELGGKMQQQGGARNTAINSVAY